MNVIFCRFSHDHPGMVFLRKTPEDAETQVQLLKDPTYRFETDMRAGLIHAPGLSLKRQNYLYRQVRRYVRQHVQDVTCPRLSEE